MSMKFRSIQWRLPISYAAIALLAAMSLGVVLLITLRSYYAQHELDYLKGNARAIGTVLVQVLEDSPEDLKLQLDSFAFLSQSRIRLLNENGEILGDSGAPQPRNFVSIRYNEERTRGVQAETTTRFTERQVNGDIFVYSAPVSPYYLPPHGDGNVSYLPSIVFFNEDQLTPAPSGTWEAEVVDARADIMKLAPRPFTQQAIPAMGTIYGFNLGSRDMITIDRRSDQTVRSAIEDVDGKPVGYVELSEGPAYGMEIVDGVARAWAVASAVAIFLAAGVGLLISRRISAPLLALTDVTTRMTAGNLTARAQVESKDEVGTLAKSFNEMANRLEETITTLRRFVADAAHELHTPLTALRTNLELIVNENSESKRIAFVERAQAQVARLETLTNSLLELSRIESGEIKRDTVLIALNNLAQETSELYASQAEQKGIEFSLEMLDDDVHVWVNDGQLRRAIGNLLENAIKFTPPGGIVRLGLRRQSNIIELWVQDTGIGIPADDLPQLFSRFHRGRNAFEYPGSGLGLAIVKAIVDYHNGQVSAENLSPGARLSLRLPFSANLQ
jgi:signal transduction histidine kinase